jgi:hypothetical protein
MDDSTSSLQRPVVPSLLVPTDTSFLKQLWLLETTREFPFNEYRLVSGIPESLKIFVDQFLKEDGVIDSDRLIWTSDDSFVRVGEDWGRGELPGVYRNY